MSVRLTVSQRKALSLLFLGGSVTYEDLVDSFDGDKGAAKTLLEKLGLQYNDRIQDFSVLAPAPNPALYSAQLNEDNTITLYYLTNDGLHYFVRKNGLFDEDNLNVSMNYLTFAAAKEQNNKERGNEQEDGAA